MRLRSFIDLRAIYAQLWRRRPLAHSSYQHVHASINLSTHPIQYLVSVWSASRTYPHDAPVDNRPCPQSARPTAETRGGTHGRNRLRKHRVPILALPAAGTRPLPAPAQLRRRLASSIPSPFHNRHTQNPDYYHDGARRR